MRDPAHYDKPIGELVDALSEYVCTSHEQIADVLGWTRPRVARMLSILRSPDVSSYFGLTVPHVPRGPGEHLYQVVEVDGEPLDTESCVHLRAGAASTLSLIATQGNNQAHALNMAARGASPKQAKVLKRVALQQEALAAMAEDAIDVLASFNGS